MQLVRVRICFLFIFLTAVGCNSALAQNTLCLNMLQRDPAKFENLRKEVWQQTPLSRLIARNFSKKLNRKVTLDEQKSLHAAFSTSDPDIALYWIQSTNSFSALERQKIYEEIYSLRQLSKRWAREESIFLNSHVELSNPASAFHAFNRKDLEPQLVNLIKQKVKFHVSTYESKLFNQFRVITAQDLQTIYKNTPVEKRRNEIYSAFSETVENLIAQNKFDTENLNKIPLNFRFSWHDHSDMEYQRVLFVFKNLGTSQMKAFSKNFGHVDYDAGATLFSLRLNPEITVENDGLSMNKNMNVRALLAVSVDGTVHVLRVYHKLSFLDSDGFKQVEKIYYQEALQRAQQLGLRLVVL